MNKFVAYFTIALLLVTGIWASVVGFTLISDTTGKTLGMSLDKLVFLPFKSYLVPGLLLLALPGISSLLIAILVSKEKKNASFLVIFQGVLLLGWTVLLTYTIPNNILQSLFATVAIFLICCGIILLSMKSKPVIVNQ